MFTLDNQLLEVKNLACRRGSKDLFRNLSFDMAEGECLIIKGHNGSGKSTLLKMLTGLISTHKGSIKWLNSLPQRSLSYLGHKDALRKRLTPYENIISHLILHQTQPRLEQIDQVFKDFEISNSAKLPCAHLSAGQNRKTSLASVVLLQKKIWILDEPFSSLDSKSCEVLLQFMQQHLQNKGLIIMASHLKECALPHQLLEIGS